MSGTPAPTQDRGPLVRPWRVVSVEPLDGYRLAVRFADGVEGTVEMSGLVHSPRAGIFAALADARRFAEVSIEHGAVTWPGDIDLAPDAMHEEIKKSGVWVLN